jgi:hypothetical protein
MNVFGHVGIRIHIVQKQAFRLERFRNLGKDARKAFQYLRKSKSDYRLKHTGNIIPDSPSSYLGRRRAFLAEGLEAPLPVYRHLSLANLPGFEDHIRSAQTDSSDPCGIPPAAHLAYLMSAALQGQNPAREKCVHYVIRADVSVVVELLHVPDNPVSLHMPVLGIIFPVGSGRGAGNVGWQVDEI